MFKRDQQKPQTRKRSFKGFKLILTIGFVFVFTGCGSLAVAPYRSQSKSYMIADKYRGAASHNNPFTIRWPIKRARLTQRFAPNHNRKHEGIDLAARKNTKIYASHGGVVVFAGRKYSGYGKMIILKYNNTWSTLYAHLNKFNVKTGSRVKKGQVIGFMGSTGRSTGVHLHFEVLKNYRPIDPLSFLDVPNKLANK